MKYIKMLGLLAVAAGALMAFAGSASATEVTSEGKLYTGVIKATAGETTLHGIKTITCKKSTVEGAVETHGSSVTASGKITHLKFEECGTDHVTVLKPGTLTVHTEYKTVVDANETHTWVCCEPNNGNGTLTSSGAEITIQVTSLGISCIFTTNETDIGRVTGGTTAKLDIDSSSIPRTGHSIFCGGSGEWTGSYTVNTPDNLTID
ncbi:MAG TPA: hypothetical protein VIL21_02395 [Solirubrobacterales bacterium]